MRAFDRTLPVSGEIDLDIQSNPGGIVVQTGAPSSVRVHAVIKPVRGIFDFGTAEANIRALEQNPPIKQDGNHIHIGYVKDLSLLNGIIIRFEIETPRATRIHARTTSGAIRIDGVHGPVVAQTASGRTEISGISGDVRAMAHSGSIRIDSTTGAVHARNSSGSIDALRITGSVNAETWSGAIRISQTAPAPIRALAHSGAIKIDLAEQADYRIDAQSHSGRVSLPPERIGTSGPLVDLDTYSSKIEVN